MASLSMTAMGRLSMGLLLVNTVTWAPRRVESQLFGGVIGQILEGTTTIGGNPSQDVLSGKTLEDLTNQVNSATSALGALTSSGFSSLGSGDLNSLMEMGSTVLQGGALMGSSSSNLGQGLTWNYGSLDPVSLATFLATSFVMPTSDPNSAINVWGNALKSGDPASVGAAFGDLLTSLDMTCGWQFTLGGAGINNNFYDKNEALHVTLIPTTGTLSYTINGVYPRARAFSYATYLLSQTGEVTFVDELTDREIVATSGENPLATGQGNGTYDIYITPNGMRGFANELKYQVTGISSKVIVIVYRVFKVDQFVDPTTKVTSKADDWGGVAPPTIRVELVNNYVLKTSFFLNMQKCNEDRNNKNIASFIDAQFDFKGGAGGVSVQCSYYNIPDNFVFFDDAQRLKSPSENHIMSCGNAAKVPAGGSPIIFLKGRLPPPALARYASISLVDLAPPGPTLYTLSDQTLRNFGAYQGRSDVDYTIVVAQNSLILAKCGFTQDVLTSQGIYPLMYGGTSAGTAFAATRNPGVVYREVMADSYEESLSQTRYACQDVNDCSNPRFFKGEMAAYYPSITWAYCPAVQDPNAAIKFVQMPKANASFPTPRLPTPAPTGLWEQLDESEKGCSPALRVNVTSLQGSEVYIDGLLAGKATDAATVAPINRARRAWAPVQAAVYNASKYGDANPAPETYTYTAANGTNVTLVIEGDPVDFMPEIVTVAVKVPIQKARSFFVSYDMCGYRRSSAAGWRCSGGPFSDKNWTKPTFDDSTWQYARAIGRTTSCLDMNSDCAFVPREAQGMWVDACPGGSTPGAGFVYCRLQLPQKCDMSCTAGMDNVAQRTCPDKDNALVAARTASSALYWLYSNGQQIGGDLTLDETTTTDMFLLDNASPTVVVAFKANDGSRSGSKSFLMGEIDMCGRPVVTDTKWRCAHTEPKDLEWTKPGFDDSQWAQAAIVNGLGQPPQPAGITRGATWIWAPNAAAKAWCRTEVTNPAYVPTQVEVEAA